MKECTQEFDDPLLDLDSVITYSPSPDIPVFPVNINGMDCDTAGFVLRTSYGIITRTGLHCAPFIHEQITNGDRCIRFSPSFLTTPDDCRYAGEMIRELADKISISNHI